MLPWQHLATARVPGGKDEMRLYQRGSEYSIRVGAYELMNSRQHASEDTFATAVCERLGKRDDLSILIGGLGMSFTLAAVLASCGAHAQIEVAELVPEVVEWNRGPLASLTNSAASDPRVRIHESDVAVLIQSASEKYDAILLDVDNGPAALTAPGNDRLYSMAGLRSAARAVKADGLLAIWSSTTDAAFKARLAAAGWDAEELHVRGHTKHRGPRYVIWIARPRVRVLKIF
jgi:spermidine synthase